MKAEEKELVASDYAIAHYENGRTYTALEVHKMLCDAFIAGMNVDKRNKRYVKIEK